VPLSPEGHSFRCKADHHESRTRPALTLQKISICHQGHNGLIKVFIPESDWGDNSSAAYSTIPRKTFPATEEKIARYFDSIKKVP